MHQQCLRACGVCTVPGTPHLERMPMVGWGTCCRQSAKGEPLKASMRDFLRLGGRLIDTALMYNNHIEIGEVMQEPEFEWLRREDLFITSKLPPADFGQRETEAAVSRALEELNTSFVDLMLLHAPSDRAGNVAAWRALERELANSRVRAIGVSNFGAGHLRELVEDGVQVMPMNNQITLHPGDLQVETLHYCREHGISVTAYNSLRMRGSVPRGEQVLQAVAAAHEWTEAQVLLRWGLDHGVAVIPGCTSHGHLREALEVARLEPLTRAELESLGATVPMRPEVDEL